MVAPPSSPCYERVVLGYSSMSIWREELDSIEELENTVLGSFRKGDTVDVQFWNIPLGQRSCFTPEIRNAVTLTNLQFDFVGYEPDGSGDPYYVFFGPYSGVNDIRHYRNVCTQPDGGFFISYSRRNRPVLTRAVEE